MKLSILIPCYNEANNLGALVNRIKETFLDGVYECVFVDDGSQDQTLQLLKSLAASEEIRCKVISFTRNFGKEAAIFAGLDQCEGEYIAMMDADLQQDPATIGEMLMILEQTPELDMVVAVQTTRRESFWMKQCKTFFYRTMTVLSEFTFPQNAGDFRTFRRHVGKAVLSMKEYQRFSQGLFYWGGFQVAYLPYQVGERLDGTSKWSFVRLFNYALGGIVSFSTRPLRIASVFGLFFMLASLISLLFPIRSLLLFLLLLIGGIQLLCLGILGEYIGGIFMQTKHRPPYFIREIYRHPVTKD